MQVSQGITDIQEPGQTNRLGDRAIILQTLTQVNTLDEVHHKILALALDDEVVRHARQMGMPQAGQDRRLALELAGVLFCRKQVLFYRHRHAEVNIECLIDGTHAALAKHTFYSITMT